MSDRAEWDREVYDHERMTGQYDEERGYVRQNVPVEAETLATFTLQILGPASEDLEIRHSLTDKRVLADLPAMLESVEEDLSDLLAEGYSCRIREWSSDE